MHRRPVTGPASCAGSIPPSRVTPNPRTAEPLNLRTLEPWNFRTFVALAATLALITIGALVAMRFQTAPTGETPAAVSASPLASATAPIERASVRPDRALREGSVELLERSKLVVLGLAT